MWNCRCCMPITFSKSLPNHLGISTQTAQASQSSIVQRVISTIVTIFSCSAIPAIQTSLLLQTHRTYYVDIGLMLRKTSSCYRSITAAAVQWKGGETQLLQEICGIDLCCFSSVARDQWGARAKERCPSLPWSFTSILPPLQPACTFHSVMKFKCHGIDLSGNKFSQRQSLKKPSLCKGVLAHYNEGWKITVRIT